MPFSQRPLGVAELRAPVVHDRASVADVIWRVKLRTAKRALPVVETKFSEQDGRNYRLTTEYKIVKR